jgi:hypothetical protein
MFPRAHYFQNRSPRLLARKPDLCLFCGYDDGVWSETSNPPVHRSLTLYTLYVSGESLRVA